MSSRSDLFRQEALEYRTSGMTSTGSVIRLGAPWLRWSIRALLVLLAAGVAACIFLRTSETSSGPAVINTQDGRFEALLPASVAPKLRSARRLELRIRGGRVVRVRVTAARPVAAQTRIAGLPQLAQPALLLTGHTLGNRTGSARRVRADAIVVLRSQRVGEVLVRQFEFMLGRGSGSS